VFARCSHLASFLLAAALLLSSASPAFSDNKGDGGGKGGGSDKPKRNRPTAKVQGQYIIRIAGYYSGSGTAQATSDGIKISAKVKDPAGKQYAFQAKQLDIVDDRFSGTGLLEGTEVQIDGRLDPRDGKGNEVLKNGRMTFTFGVNGHHSRGAGEQRQGGRTSDKK